MAEIKTIYKGESVTLLFTFPEAYDMARLASHKVFVGETEFTGVKGGQTIRLQLKSSDTDRMIGTHKVVLWIDDAVLGLRKPYCGDLVVVKTQASGSNTSVSNISDIIIHITISETAITVDDILYNYVKGDPFEYSDFTPEQIAELQQPAKDAIASIQEVELAVEQAEGLRQQAELNRQTNTSTAIFNAEQATDDANDAAILANEKAGLANEKALLANEKAGLAATATTQANTARDGANSAATNANNVANTYAADLAAKELKTNKQNNLTADGTGTKFPTVDAVNAGLALAKDSVIYDSVINSPFLTGNWSADEVTDTLTSTVEHGLVVDDTVSFDIGTGILPTGITSEPEYYFVESVPTTTSLKLKTLFNGTALDITANGTTGWKIRKASIANPINLDFANYTEIDIVSTNASVLQSFGQANTYWKILFEPEQCRLFLNDTAVYGSTSYALLYNVGSTKKYVKTPFRINIRKIDVALYFIEIYINGLFSDNIDFSSPTAYTRTFTGILTGADITKIEIVNGYTGYIKSGARTQIIKRA